MEQAAGQAPSKEVRPLFGLGLVIGGLAFAAWAFDKSSPFGITLGVILAIGCVIAGALGRGKTEEQRQREMQ